MTTYILRRLLQIIPTLLGITLVTFVLVRLTGDPATMMLPPETPPEAVAQFRHELGLDQPLHVQYLKFLLNAARGDFGMSIRYREPVSKLFLERLPATLELGGTALVLSILIGVPTGILSSVRKNSWLDNFARLGALFGQAIPTFYLGLMLIIVVSVQLRWLPTGGRGTLRQLILPALTLAAYLTAIIARFTRGAMLDALSQDYVRTARSKGLNESGVLWRHVLKNAMIPVITVIGLQVGNVLAGSVITETVFAWPGVGRLMVSSITTRDFPIVQATVMIIALIFVTVNLLVDLMYAWLDPRIKYQ